MNHTFIRLSLIRLSLLLAAVNLPACADDNKGGKSKGTKFGTYVEPEKVEQSSDQQRDLSTEDSVADDNQSSSTPSSTGGLSDDTNQDDLGQGESSSSDEVTVEVGETGGEGKVAASCENTDLIHRQTLRFEGNRFAAGHQCDWFENGTAGEQKHTFAAKHETKLAIDIPEGAQLCDIEFLEPESPITTSYDDRIIIHFNKRIILASQDVTGDLTRVDGVMKALPRVDGFAKFSWVDLHRTFFTPAEDNFCLEGASCTLPASQERPGPFQLTLNKATGQKLVESINKEHADRGDAHSYHVSTLVFGDEDFDGDCRRDDIAIEVKAKYFVPDSN